MEENTKQGIRELVPEHTKAHYRLLRARLLSIGLRSRHPLFLSDEERRASSEISIVVAVHDAPEITASCLKSLETFGGSSEIIIVDDGSRLASSRRLLEDVCSRNHWQYLRHDVALGHSRACEAGVLFARRPYICLLNSDTVVTPCAWLGILRAFEAAPEIAVVGPSTSHTCGPQIVSRALHCRHYWSNEQICLFAQRYVAKHCGDPIVDLPAVGGFAFFVRRGVWDQMGGFDNNLPDYGNESEFCQRVIEAGLRIVWTRGSYIHHLGSASYGGTLGVNQIKRRCIEATAYIQRKANQ